ncbi:MAG: tetratricopeptide repeat protein [Phycisphaerales bacterium]
MRRFGLVASLLVLVVGAVVVSVLRQEADDTSEPREITPTISVPLPNDLALLSPSLRPIVRDAAARCEANRSDPEPFAELGRIYHGNGESILAKRSYEIALLLGADDAQTPYYLGLLLQDLGRTDQSIERFSSSIAIDATYAPSHYNLGLALLDAARTEESLTAFNQAVALDPNDAVFHTGLAMALRQAGRFDEAATSLRTALSLNPQLASAHQLLGLSLQAMGETEAAQQHLDQVRRYSTQVVKDPWLGQVQRYAASFQVVLRQAQAYLAADRIQSAVTLLNKAAGNYSDRAAVHRLLGQAYQQAGQPQRAVDAYQRAARLEPHDADTHAQLAIILFNHNNLADANREMQLALQADPLNAQALVIKGALTLRRGQPAEAVEILESVLQRRSDLVAAHICLGQARESLGQYDQAAGAFQRAAALQPNLELAHRRLGVIYRQLGRFADSKRELETALQLDPTIQETQQELEALRIEWEATSDQR